MIRKRTSEQPHDDSSRHRARLCERLSTSLWTPSCFRHARCLTLRLLGNQENTAQILNLDRAGPRKQSGWSIRIRSTAMTEHVERARQRCILHIARCPRRGTSLFPGRKAARRSWSWSCRRTGSGRWMPDCARSVATAVNCRRRRHRVLRDVGLFLSPPVPAPICSARRKPPPEIDCQHPPPTQPQPSGDQFPV